MNPEKTQPPINFTVTIASFSCEWNFVNDGEGNSTAIIWITDKRGVTHELYVLDRLQGPLPAAFDLGGARVRFFAHLNTITPVLTMLHGAETAWLIAKNGIMTVRTRPSHD